MRLSLRQPTDWIADWRNAIFAALLILQLTPIWAFKYFPSQDGPSHLYNAVLLRDYDRPDREIFREYYTPNTRPVPNWLSGLLLSGLARFVSPLVAEKIVMSIYLLLLPLAMRYCLTAIRPRAGMLAAAMLPFVPNFFFHMGFINFCFSFAMFFIVLGYWLSHRRDFQTRHAFALAALSLMAYFTHLVGAVMAWMFIIVLSLVMQPSTATIAQRIARRWRVYLAGVPTAALMAFFFLGPKLGPDLSPALSTWWKRLRYPITWMKSFDRIELIASAAVILAIGVTALALWIFRTKLANSSARRLHAYRAVGAGWLVMVVVCTAVFLISPDSMSGGTYLVIRLAPFPLIALLFWIASQPISQRRFDRVATTLCGIGGASAAILLAVHVREYAQLNPYVREMESLAPYIAPNTTLLPVDLADGATVLLGAKRRPAVMGVDPFLHATEHNLAERGVVALKNSWAITGYHRLRYRAETNPYQEDRPPTDLKAYPLVQGRPIDYVLVWTGGNEKFGPSTLRIRRQLAEGYELIAKSSYSGYGELYRRNDFDTDTARASD